MKLYADSSHNLIIKYIQLFKLLTLVVYINDVYYVNIVFDIQKYTWTHQSESNTLYEIVYSKHDSKQGVTI